jgi:hypothetical protein
MNWQDWTYRTNAMDIRSNFLSAPNVYHPSNTLWQPLSDGWRLAGFQNTPPGADVGLGFARGGTPLSYSAITDRLAVRLSSFSTNLVSVDFSLELPGLTLATGTLQFQPGETLKFIPDFSAPPDANIARVHLGNPIHAEITSGDSFYIVRSVTPDMNLQLLWFGSDRVLFWTDPAAFLQQADSLNSPWTDVQATSPFELDLSGPQKFYRLKK